MGCCLKGRKKIGYEANVVINAASTERELLAACDERENLKVAGRSDTVAESIK
jgi:hypothetical protein